MSLMMGGPSSDWWSVTFSGLEDLRAISCRHFQLELVVGSRGSNDLLEVRSFDMVSLELGDWGQQIRVLDLWGGPWGMTCS